MLVMAYLAPIFGLDLRVWVKRSVAYNSSKSLLSAAKCSGPEVVRRGQGISLDFGKVVRCAQLS